MFCDTSTLAKYYEQEAESAAVRAALDTADHVLASELAKAELMAVFHRRWREGKWREPVFRAHCRQFARDDASGLWTWMPVTSGTVFLRTADCVHLLTALQHGFSEIHTHDTHQFAAAASLGLKPIALA